MTFSGMGACSRPWVRRYSAARRADLFGGGAQSELAQHVEVALAEEVGERLLDLFRRVDLSLAQAGAQLVDGDVDVDHFVGALEEAVGNGLADRRCWRSG